MFNLRKTLNVFVSLAIAGFVCLSAVFISAQNSPQNTADFDVEKICPTLVEKIDEECQRLGVEECRKALEDCEKFYQQKSGEYKGEIGILQTKQKTLKNQIQLLDSKIKSLNSQISTNNLKVKYLSMQIEDTQSSIDTTNVKIEDIKGKLGNLIQLQYEEDQKTTAEILLSGSELSDFFENIMALEALNGDTKNLLKRIKELKSNLQNQQDKMVGEKGDLENTVMLNTLQKQENQKTQSEKQDILAQTKGQEALYQKYLQESEAKAKEIRKKIFELAQVPEGEAVTLEQAYNLAKEVEKLTGVRPAFLLGLLQAESAIGKNVGQCNCAGASFCKNPDITYKQVMPQSNWATFETITEELGLNINKTPVSCSISGGKVQWGGAMGPAQFMPNTWLNSGYKSRVESLTGVKPANPWKVRDAFLAAGLYLSDNGAGSQKQTDEISAATAYLCGTKKMTSTCIAAGGKGYVYQIMQNASVFQGYVEQGILK